MLAIPRAASPRIDSVSGSVDGRSSALRLSVSSICLAWRSISTRRSLQARATACEQVAEARQPVPRLGREVRAGVERLSLRRHEDGRRPAAGARHPDGRLHRHRIDVRPLLAVDLDVDEELVHERSGVRILERLVRHHVAPVARAVADRDEERLLLGACELERLVAPGMPVDGVLGVLQEVRAGRVSEAVHRSHRTQLTPSGGGLRVPRMDRQRIGLWGTVIFAGASVVGVMVQLYLIGGFLFGETGWLDAHKDFGKVVPPGLHPHVRLRARRGLAELARGDLAVRAGRDRLDPGIPRRRRRRRAATTAVCTHSMRRSCRSSSSSRSRIGWAALRHIRVDARRDDERPSSRLVPRVPRTYEPVSAEASRRLRTCRTSSTTRPRVKAIPSARTTPHTGCSSKVFPKR